MLSFRPKRWADVKIGDIVLVWNDEEFPATILLVSSSSSKAYIDTNRINGEMVIVEKKPIAHDIGGGHIQFLKGCVYINKPDNTT